MYLSVIAILPIVTGNIFGYSNLAIGGTSIIIVVGVALDIFIKMMSTVANTLAPIFARISLMK